MQSAFPFLSVISLEHERRALARGPGRIASASERTVSPRNESTLPPNECARFRSCVWWCSNPQRLRAMKTNVWYLIGMVAAATVAVSLYPDTVWLSGVAAGIAFALLAAAIVDAFRNRSDNRHQDEDGASRRA